MNKTNKPLALYIHIPFCHDICGYCDFAKIRYFPDLADKYLFSLEKELKSLHINHQLKTIYIGGGTPTALSDEQFKRLMDLIKPYTKGVIEYTIEANPESLTKEKLLLMKDGGVNRLSIGVESTNDKILSLLNRKHTFEDVKKAYLEARLLGFDNISFDLILGLPNVTKKMISEDIDNIISLNPEHISCYSLTVHENTKFYIDGIREVEPDISREMYDIVEEHLISNGYIHYEVSNWCKPNRKSLHNMTYWKDEEYYAIGLGAAFYVNNVRGTNTRNLTKYLNGEFLEESSEVSLREDMNYFIMLNLRTNEGLSLDSFFERFGVNLCDDKKEMVDSFVIQKLLRIENNSLIPTYVGMMVLDQIILNLVY